MPEAERLRFAIPTGELESDVMMFFRNIGLTWHASPRQYLLSVETMPLDLLIVRASDVARSVFVEDSPVKAGITGSDLLWEYGKGKDAGEIVPISTLNAHAKQWSLYVGITRGFQSQIRHQQYRDAMLFDLTGTMIATKYPHITQEYFIEKKVSNIDIYPIEGKDEAAQYWRPRCYSVLGVWHTGATAHANGIDPLDIFYQGTVRMIEAAGKLTRLDNDILNDLRERIAATIEKKAK